MSDTITDPLAALRQRVRELELEAVAIKARHQEAVELLALLEHSQPRRPGRPRRIEIVGSCDAPQSDTAA